MKNHKEIIGIRIRTQREKKEFTQASLAKKIGVGRTRVTKWETGKNLPTGDLRETLLRILDAKSDEIFGFDTESKLISLQVTETEFNSNIKRLFKEALKETYTTEEKRLIDFFRAADEAARSGAERLLRDNPKVGSKQADRR